MAYQPIQMPQPEGLGGFSNFLMQIAQQNRADDARRAELLLRQQSAQDEMRHRQVLEQHSGAQLKIQQDQANEAIAQKRLAATTQITAALDSGRPDLARQIAKTFGIPINERPAQDPRDTLMKPSIEMQGPPSPIEEGPRATPEIAKQAGLIRSEIASFEPNAQGDAYHTGASRDELSRFNEQQDRGAQPQMQYVSQGLMPARGTQYEVNGENYDPEQVRRAADEKRTRSTQRFATAMGDVQGLEKYIPIYTSGVEAGLEPEKAFELMQKRMQSDDERAARDETARLQREQSDTNNRRIAAAMGNRVTHDDPFKQRTADRGDETSLDTVTKNVFGQLGFKEQQVANRKFNDMAAAASKPNAALDAVTAGSFVKMAQGGTGVISDSDMEQFWNRIGGVKERSAQWVENVISGKIATDKRSLVIQGVKELAARAKYNLDTVKDAVKYRLDNSAFADRAPDVIGTYFPGERSAIEESRAIDRAKNRTRATRIKGGGRDALDAELDNL